MKNRAAYQDGPVKIALNLVEDSLFGFLIE